MKKTKVDNSNKSNPKTYPKGFLKLCGSIKEDVEEPKDLPLEKEDFDV